MQKTRYRVNGKSIIIRIAAVLMYLAVVFRLLSCWGPLWKGADVFFVTTQVALPVVSCLLFAVMIRKLGEKLFVLTFIPVLMGVVFFVIYATTLSVISMIVCIIVSVVVAVVYTTTVMGGFDTKWFLPPLFGVPFLYRLIVKDAATIMVKENAMSLGEFIPELSILCMLLSLLLVSFAMKKKKPPVDDGTAILEGSDVMDSDEPLIIDSRPADTLATPADAVTDSGKENSQEENSQI